MRPHPVTPKSTWPPEPVTAPTRRETMRELVARERRERENDDTWRRAS